MKSEQSKGGWYFLLIVVGVYVLVGIIKPDAILPSLRFFLKIFESIVLIFVLVFFVLVVFNYLIRPERLVKWMEKGKGVGGWIMVLLGGMISTGPIYMWYPLMNEMKKHKIKDRYLATFLYNRAIKPALLPFLIFYFGWTYTIVLTVVMSFLSMIQGYLVEKLVGWRK